MTDRKKYKVFGEMLRKARERRGMNQSELARQLFVDYSTVSHWENGSRRPSIETLLFIAEDLEMGEYEVREFLLACDYSPTLIAPRPVRPVGAGLLQMVKNAQKINEERGYAIDGSPEALRTASLALTVEVGELLQELNWKQWKNEKVPDKDLVAEEFADVLFFLGNLLCNVMVQADLTLPEIEESYEAKLRVNVKRSKGQVQGYEKPIEPNGGASD